MFLFHLIVDLYFLIPAVITQLFNRNVELAISAGIPTNKIKKDTETRAMTAEIK